LKEGLEKERVKNGRTEQNDLIRETMQKANGNEEIRKLPIMNFGARSKCINCF